MTDYVVGFAVTPATAAKCWWLRSVLLVRKNRPEWQAGRLNGPGGKVEEVSRDKTGGLYRLESPEQAMAREFLEETGVEIVADRWRHRVTLRGDGWSVHFLTADALWEEVELAVTLAEKSDEPMELYEVHRLPADVVPNVRWLLPLCLDPSIVAPLEVLDTNGDNQGTRAELGECGAC